MPTRVWDDGRQTYFEFAEQTPIPAIFAAGPGKKDEALVNVATRGRIQVNGRISALLELGMESTDGTGATLAWPLVRAAAALLSEVAEGADPGPSRPGSINSRIGDLPATTAPRAS